jgi:hypothetical protein
MIKQVTTVALAAATSLGLVWSTPESASRGARRRRIAAAVLLVALALAALVYWNLCEGRVDIDQAGGAQSAALTGSDAMIMPAETKAPASPPQLPPALVQTHPTTFEVTMPEEFSI